MSNYFNSLSEKDKLNQLGKCRFMKSEEFSDGVNTVSYTHLRAHETS